MTGITVTGITITGIIMTGMMDWLFYALVTVTGISQMTGVIQTRHTRCHTDIQTGWYAGIMNYFSTPSTGLRSHLLIFVYSSFSHLFLFIESSHRQLLFIPVMIFFFVYTSYCFLFAYTSQRQICLYQSVNFSVYISHQCPRGGERLAGR